MKTHEKSIHIVLSVIAAVSSVRSISIDFDSEVLIPLSERTHLKLGRGGDTYDLPFTECTKTLTGIYQLNCEVTIRSGDKWNNRCKVILAADQSTMDIEIDWLYQFPHQRVVIFWHYLPTSPGIVFNSFVNKTTSVNMENCSDTVTQSFPAKPNDWNELSRIYFYNDGFDAVVRDMPSSADEKPRNHLVKFDTGARQLDKSIYNYRTYFWDKISTEGIKYELNFLEYPKDKGVPIEILKQEGQWTTYCMETNERDSMSFRCVNVEYTYKHATYEEQVNLAKPVKLVDVYGLKGCGIVLFALEGNSTLNVIEMQGKHAKMQTYLMRWPASNSDNIIVHFDNENGSFSVAWETNEARHSVVLRSFNLPRKFY